MEENQKRRGDEGGVERKTLAIVLATAVVVVALFVGIGWFVNNMQDADARGDADYRRELQGDLEIEYKGEKYRLKRNLTTILLMGIDLHEEPDTLNEYRNGGQADFQRLLVIDGTNEKIYQIAIDRDTLTPITVLGVLGNRAGTRVDHVSLAHAFGDGKEQSCKLAEEAVSNLYYGVPIDCYLALELDGISELNDWLGGVTVTLEDDFSSFDPTMQQGATVKLVGNQAEVFVRERMSIGVGTNEARMARQSQYLDEAERLLIQRFKEDEHSAENLYDSLESYFTTDLSRGRLTNIVVQSNGYEVVDAIQPEGEHSVDKDGFMQFEVDDDSLQQVMLEVFYEKVQ